jgi:uncharacterized protein YbjT (DUF2867 family)
MIVTVMGATGNTGKAAVERLLAAGVQVRGVSRSADKLRALGTQVQPFPGEVTDAATLTEALRGSDGLYAMVPSDYGAPDLLAYYAKVVDAVAAAVSASGVKRVAFLSSIGGDLAAGTGPILGLHRGEERLKALPGIDLLVLRPCYFYENFFGSLGLIKSQGINGGAARADVPYPMIDARDVGAAAGDALARRDFSGTSMRELYGPRDLTMTECTRMIGVAIGKPELAYVQFPDDGFAQALRSAGFSQNAATLMLEMIHAFNEQRVPRHQPRTPANTGATAFESFATVFAQVYRGS